MLDTNKQDKDKEVQELGKWGEKVGYKLGFLAGAATFGLVFGVVLGALFILNYSKNEGLKNLTTSVSKRAQKNQISLKDLEKLSTGKRVSNQKCIRAAMFIDGLENKVGSLTDGKIVGKDFSFTKTIDPSGLINYKVENSKTNQVVLDFNLSQDGEIAIQSRNETEETSKLNEFIVSNADKVSVDIDEDMSLYSDETSQAAIVEQEVKSVKTSIEALNRIDLARLATSSESAQLHYIETTDELNQQLFELEARAKVIRSQIQDSETANDKEGQRHPENTFLGIKVSNLIDKLVGLDKQIDSLQTDLQEKPQTVEEVRAYRQAAKVDSTAPTTETDALRQEIRELQERVRMLTPEQSRFAPPPLPNGFNQSPQHGSFGEESEYPDLPADLNELQVSQFPELDELLHVSESPANGQPITIVETEVPDYVELQGIEQ